MLWPQQAAFVTPAICWTRFFFWPEQCGSDDRACWLLPRGGGGARKQSLENCPVAGVSVSEQAHPTPAIHHPAWLMYRRGRSDCGKGRGCRPGEGMLGEGAAGASHAACLGLGAGRLGRRWLCRAWGRSLEASRGLAGRGWNHRPPCPPWSATPSAPYWRRLSFHTAGPSVSPESPGELWTLDWQVAWLGLPLTIRFHWACLWALGLLPAALGVLTLSHASTLRVCHSLLHPADARQHLPTRHAGSRTAPCDSGPRPVLHCVSPTLCLCLHLHMVVISGPVLWAC